MNNTWIFVELVWLKIVLKGASTVLGFKHEHSMRLGTISLKIYRSLDVNTQKCRQWVNKICVPFWCSSWIDNYKGKIIFRQISARQGNPSDRLHFTNDCFSQKNGLLGLFACALWPKGLMCSWDIKGLFHHTNQSR